MSPTRRTVLRAGGLAAVGTVAGCLSSARPTDESPIEPPSNDTDPTMNNSDDTRPTGTGGPGVHLAATDDAPDLPVVPTVEVTEDTATDDHPPQLRVTVTNESEETVRVGEGRAIVFAYVTDDADDLVLLPADDEYPASPGCWRLTEPVATTMEYRIVELEAGESVSQLVDLYGAPEGEGCLPVGEHRFETGYNVMEGGETDAEGEVATWGFRLLLE